VPGGHLFFLEPDGRAAVTAALGAEIERALEGRAG
jgi:hypothetical protein